MSKYTHIFKKIMLLSYFRFSTGKTVELLDVIKLFFVFLKKETEFLVYKMGQGDFCHCHQVLSIFMMQCSIGFSLNALFADFNVCQLFWITYYILISTLSIKYNISGVNIIVKFLLLWVFLLVLINQK